MEKNMNFKKILAVMLMVCLSLGVFAVASPDVRAADLSSRAEAEETEVETDAAATFDVTYNASDAYKSSKYYENLKKVPKSGNQAYDVAAIALSQVGYHEGESEADFGGSNESGAGDYVEYNKLFGIIDYNVRYGYPWCVSFATWCLRQAGVTLEQSYQTDELKKTFISSWQLKNAFEDASAFHVAEGYTPKIGDIIFFKDVDDKTLEKETSHVGIVIHSDKEYVYTVEGNANEIMGKESTHDSVAVKTHPLDSKYIVGYGQPAYENADGKEPYGWRDASDPDADPKPIERMIEDVKNGVQIIPVWENNVSVAQIVITVSSALILIAAITVISAMTFKKKADDRNSGRHKESQKSRNKYHGKNKGAKRK